jgi:putative transposase
MTIYAGSINRDYVHMLISIPPQLSVSRGVQYLKGRIILIDPTFRRFGVLLISAPQWLLGRKPKLSQQSAN